MTESAITLPLQESAFRICIQNISIYAFYEYTENLNIYSHNERHDFIILCWKKMIIKNCHLWSNLVHVCSKCM